MSNAQNKLQKKAAIAHAAKVLRQEIAALGEQIKTTPEGAEKDALIVQIRELMDSIGMEYTGESTTVTELSFTNEEDQPETVVSVGSVLLKNIQQVTDNLAANSGASTTDVKVEVKVETEQPGLWTRFKGFCGNNKKKLIGGILALAGIGIAVWYYVSGKNTTTTVSSVKGMTETVTETTVESTEQTGQVDPSVFARIGEFFIKAAGKVQGYAVASWAWITGLFTKSAAEATVEIQAETVPAV